MCAGTRATHSGAMETTQTQPQDSNDQTTAPQGPSYTHSPALIRPVRGRMLAGVAAGEAGAAAGRQSRATGSLPGGQVGEQAVQVTVGLGVHGLAEPLVELGLVQAAFAEVLAERVGHGLALGVGDPEVGRGGPLAQEPGRGAEVGHLRFPLKVEWS